MVKWDVYIFGDPNTRVGDLDDSKESFDLSGGIEKVEMPRTLNQDIIVNQCGERMVDFCVSRH